MNEAVVGVRPYSRTHPLYVLLVLGLVSALNYYDRNLITILVEPVKRDLGLSDTDIGMLSGFGFALMYSVLGIPMARLADRYGRARTLAAVVAIWSFMTTLSGRATGYTSMLLARVGVGVGEAGGLPATHALVADYFPPQKRGRALSVIGIAGALGLSLALGAGGYIADHYSWRMAFYLGGVPGLLVALVVACTVREPRARVLPGEASDSLPLRVAVARLRGRRAYVCLCIGMGIACIGGYGQFAWTPAFLQRAFHMSASAVGGYYSLVSGPATLVSVFAGGAMNDWLLKRDKRWPLWLLALCFGTTVPAGLVMFTVHNFTLAMGMSVLTTLLGGLWVAPAYALVQSLAGPTMRALAAAIFMMVTNIIGLGLGPYLTGVLSDRLTPSFGEASLGMSLCIVTVTCAVGTAIFLAGNRTIEADLRAAETS